MLGKEVASRLLNDGWKPTGQSHISTSVKIACVKNKSHFSRFQWSVVFLKFHGQRQAFPLKYQSQILHLKYLLIKTNRTDGFDALA